MTYTKEQIRGAILRAADRIERDPAIYSFGAIRVPLLGDCGCMVGHIGSELGSKPGAMIYQVSWDIGIAKRGEIIGSEDKLYNCCGLGYTSSSAVAVAGMRKFADRYFPAEMQEQAPTLDPAYLAFKRALVGTEAVS